MIQKLIVLVLLVQVQGTTYTKNSRHNQHRPARPGHQHPAMSKYYQLPKGSMGAPKYPRSPPPAPHWQNRGASPHHGRPGGDPPGPNGGPSGPWFGPPKTVVPRSPQPYLHKPPPNFIPLSGHWKPPVPPHFRIPPKEPSFSGPPHPPHQGGHHSRYHDDDRGPIRTIPAPNLNPADKPVHHHYPEINNQVVPEVNPFIHAQQSNVESFNGYQVTEDPSLHKPQSGQESYFAPDPDPNVPTLKVPPTTDPHSLPSNGKLPLDIALQQEADHSNRLTAQELFNLMNGFHPGTGGVSLVAPQYIAPAPAYSPLYTAPTIYMPVVTQNLDSLQHLEPQAMPANFHPQMETFNYDERTQQNAHGSDSFPEASSINMEQEMEKQGSQRANYYVRPNEPKKNQNNGGDGGNDKRHYVNKSGHSDTNSGESDEGVASNQVDFERPEVKSAAEKKAQKIQASMQSSKHGAETLATLAQLESFSAENERNNNNNEDVRQDTKPRTSTPESPPILDVVRGDIVDDETDKPSHEIIEETRPVFNPSFYQQQTSYHTHYSESKNGSQDDSAKQMRVHEIAYSSKINGARSQTSSSSPTTSSWSSSSSKETPLPEHPANHKTEYRVEESESSSEEDSREGIKELREGGGDSNLEIMEATDSSSLDGGIRVVSLETSYASSDEGPRPLNSHSQLPYGARLRVKSE